MIDRISGISGPSAPLPSSDPVHILKQDLQNFRQALVHATGQDPEGLAQVATAITALEQSTRSFT